jgi:hypothetical protein
VHRGGPYLLQRHLPFLWPDIVQNRLGLPGRMYHMQRIGLWVDCRMGLRSFLEPAEPLTTVGIRRPGARFPDPDGTIAAGGS